MSRHMAKWTQTYTGRCVDPLEVDPREVRLADIAHALAMKCRFGGHCQQFYSVAEHRVRVSVLLQQVYPHSIKLLLLGLLHDAAETYLPDIVAPIKARMHTGTSIGIKAFKEAEDRALMKIFAGLGLNWAGDFGGDSKTQKTIKHADLTMLATEGRDLMGECEAEWASLPAPDPVCIAPMTWREARSAFVSRWRELWPLLHVTNSGPGGWDEQHARTAYPNGWEEKS